MLKNCSTIEAENFLNPPKNQYFNFKYYLLILVIWTKIKGRDFLLCIKINVCIKHLTLSFSYLTTQKHVFQCLFFCPVMALRCQVKICALFYLFLFIYFLPFNLTRLQKMYP